jgi:hypothetical protein
VTIWLCKKIFPTVGIFAGIEHDPPITVAKKLLLAAQVPSFLSQVFNLSFFDNILLYRMLAYHRQC